MAHEKRLVLPSSIVSPTQIGNLVDELDSINEQLLEERIKKKAGHPVLPQSSLLMEELAKANTWNLLKVTDRTEMAHFLRAVKQRAPVVHMSFSSDPSPGFVDKLINWFRSEVHPDMLLSIGLQPAIGAGCVLRTTNKYFDLSLRQDFIDKRPLLLESLKPPVAPKATA